MTNATDFFDMNRAPMRIGSFRLKVRDLEGISAFYQSVLGLKVIEAGAQSVTLGTGSKPLLMLEGDQTLAPRDPRQPGLFHSAFLLPSRAELARWLSHVAQQRVPLQGASDHNVSEAIYLADPEGNGIEVYADTPLSIWRGAGGEIHMTTEPLNLEKLLKAGAGSRWAGFPEDGSIGHLHLQVGDTALADRFYRDVLGFEVRNDVGYQGMRWITVGPADQPDTAIVLQPPEALPDLTDEERRVIEELHTGNEDPQDHSLYLERALLALLGDPMLGDTRTAASLHQRLHVPLKGACSKASVQAALNRLRDSNRITCDAEARWHLSHDGEPL